MNHFNHQKYRPFTPIELPNRQWPNRVINKAPNWCSVDLRDGNQALAKPMNVEQKTRLFKLLLKLGFKEIEVGFPVASQADFDFVRKLIEQNMIPDDVTIQVLTQAREDLIARSYESLKGVKQAIMHVYNSTSPVQREQVFGRDKQGIIDIALTGAKSVKAHAKKHPETQWTFQYSPESFSSTELEYAVDICSEVINVWKADKPEQRIIINLPATVEMSTPNVYADQIEWFCQQLPQREHVEISLHTHNDRGCGIAAAELGVMAGADRVEGTLLGNGERTGNMDIVTMAMNLYSRGIDPELDLSDMAEIIDCVMHCTQLPVHPRHPWAGELVYTAFSGSHQDAIKKSISYHEEHQLSHWEVAYLPIDPRDIGREYEEIVRITSQSGKGGIALVLERDYGITLPKWMQASLSQYVQAEVEASGAEISSSTIHALFNKHFIHIDEAWKMQSYKLNAQADGVMLEFKTANSSSPYLKGFGKGALEALVDAIKTNHQIDMRILHFDEYAMRTGTRSEAMAAVAVEIKSKTYYACAIDKDSMAAGLRALLLVVSRVVNTESITRNTRVT